MSADKAKKEAKEAAKTTAYLMEPTVTVDDLKRKAEQVRDIAQAEVKRVTSEELTRTLLIAAAAVGIAVSFAYFLGTRRR